MRLGPASFANLLELIWHDERSAKQIAEETGLQIDTVRDTLKCLKRRKLCYIARWAKDGHGKHSIRMWRFGDGRDAVKPKPMTYNERKQAWRMKARAIAMIRITAGAGNADTTKSSDLGSAPVGEAGDSQRASRQPDVS